MPTDPLARSPHFSLMPLADGVYACIHRRGGAAFSNAGIIDLGDRTLVVDAFETRVAGRDLRAAAEDLFGRPVDTLILTHAHNDHWIGAAAFDPGTCLLASTTTRRLAMEWGAELMQEYQNPARLEQALRQAKEQLDAEPDPRVRAGLENTITRMSYTIAEMADYRPRYPHLTFEGEVTFHGSRRQIVVRSLGRGHSEDDTVVLLPEDDAAFLGDIGFFAMQPFLGHADLGRHREQLLYLRESDFKTLVPGHGPVGGKADLALQLRYLDVLEEQVGAVVRRGGSLEEALQIRLPPPLDGWLHGGMSRFETNVRALFIRAGGEIPAEA